jgi:hypothetical protein
VVLAAMVGFAAASSSGGAAVRASAPIASKPLHNLLQRQLVRLRMHA